MVERALTVERAASGRWTNDTTKRGACIADTGARTTLVVGIGAACGASPRLYVRPAPIRLASLVRAS